jgi:multidrug efflux pump subunit AcrB
MGEAPAVAAEKGGQEVALPVLAATLTTVVVFFPVTLLYGVSKFLFSALALAVVLSMFASYVVAMTVVPLFCARYVKHAGVHGSNERIHDFAQNSVSLGDRFNSWFNRQFSRLLAQYERAVQKLLLRPAATLIAFFCLFGVSLLLFPLWASRSFRARMPDSSSSA